MRKLAPWLWVTASVEGSQRNTRARFTPTREEAEAKAHALFGAVTSADKARIYVGGI